MCVMPNASFLLLGTTSGHLIGLEPQETQGWDCVFIHLVHSSRIYDVAVAESGDQVASAGEDALCFVSTWTSLSQNRIGIGACETLKAASPRATHRILWGHALPVIQIAFSPDGRFLSALSIDGHLRLHDLRSVSVREGQHAYLDYNTGFLSRCFVFSADGTHGFVGGEGLARIDFSASIRPPLENSMLRLREAEERDQQCGHGLRVSRWRPPPHCFISRLNLCTRYPSTTLRATLSQLSPLVGDLDRGVEDGASIVWEEAAALLTEGVVVRHAGASSSATGIEKSSVEAIVSLSYAGRTKKHRLTQLKLAQARGGLEADVSGRLEWRSRPITGRRRHCTTTAAARAAHLHLRKDLLHVECSLLMKKLKQKAQPK